MTCLDDEMVLGLVEGRLAAPALAAIDAHVDACASCREVIAHVARGRSPAHVLERGQQIGRYVLGDVLGAGAMGRVYAAWEPELDRRVALKLLDDGGHARVLREAQAMARLDHPNVVGVHEVGTSAHGVYVAMDLVDGETLRAWARGRSWREQARVLVDVARGLAAVHAAGVLHRDVKPDNVIVGRDGRARLGDFGLARSGPVDATTPGGAVLATGTPATAVAGTPAYMALELLRGGAATAASDQFAFGVTAYEVLAGARPFAGASWAELADAIDRGTVARLRGVPSGIDAIVRRCLARDPARRFASMDAVADALAARLGGRRTSLWLGGAAAAAIVASGATWLATREAAAPSCEVGAAEIATVWNADARSALWPDKVVAAIDRWATAWADERDAVCRASRHDGPLTVDARARCLTRGRDQLAALLARAREPGADPLRLPDALAAMPPVECIGEAVRAVRSEAFAPRDADAVAAVERELPDLRAALALGDARAIGERIAPLVERARASAHPPLLAEALIVQAEVLRATSRITEADATARDAVIAAERGRDDLTAARAWIARLAIAGDRRDLARADELGELAAAAIERAGGAAHLTAQLLRMRGLVAYNRGDLARARELLADARARHAELAGERSIEVAAVESALGTVARAAGDLDAAERHHRFALELDRELRPITHPDLARDLHNLAGVLRVRGDLAGAHALYMQALAVEEATRGKRSVEVALTRNSLALVAMARGAWADARPHLEAALEILRDAGHGDAAFVEHNLGLVAAATDQHAVALAHYAAATAAYAQTIGDTAAAPIRLGLDRARSELALGRRTAAHTSATRAREGAARAGLAWIVEDADALLAGTPRAVERPLVVERLPASIAPTVAPTAPAAAPVSPPPAPPPAPGAPQPRRDVGVYGSSQGW